MSPRMICFDWGGVILKHCRSWEEGCAAARLPVRFDPREATGLARRRELSRLHQTGRVTHEEYLGLLRESTGNTYTLDELERVHAAWLLDEYPGVAEVIARLVSTAGIETGLLSNTNHAHWVTHLPAASAPPKYPTASLLKHRHASHLMGMMKPDEDIYREFERLTGARGGEILFFDDLEDNVRTAQSIGWNAVRVDHTGDTAAQITSALIGHRVWPGPA
ncbi:MAG: HAD-IA family hydrolase [Phycisphaerales bacterium]